MCPVSTFRDSSRFLGGKKNEMTCPKSLSESELGLGPVLLCLTGLFQAFSQRVFLPLLNMVLLTMKCSPQGLKQIGLDCE